MINIHISFYKFQIVAKSPLQKNAEEAAVAPVVNEPPQFQKAMQTTDKEPTLRESTPHDTVIQSMDIE